MLAESDALLIVDVQRDFLPGGSLAVPAGDEVVPVLAAMAGRFVSAPAGIGIPILTHLVKTAISAGGNCFFGGISSSS